MTSKAQVDAFTAQGKLAVVGVSRSGGKFGWAIYNEMKQKGYTMYAVNRQGGEVQGVPLYASIAALPEKVDGVIVVVPPKETPDVLRDAAAAGVHSVWLQQGSESPEAKALCDQLGLDAVTGECILMFAGQAGFHKFHRWFKGLFGGLPK